jgi:hypothetical protein
MGQYILEISLCSHKIVKVNLHKYLGWNVLVLKICRLYIYIHSPSGTVAGACDLYAGMSTVITECLLHPLDLVCEQGSLTLD